MPMIINHLNSRNLKLLNKVSCDDIAKVNMNSVSRQKIQRNRNALLQNNLTEAYKSSLGVYSLGIPKRRLL